MENWNAKEKRLLNQSLNCLFRKERWLQIKQEFKPKSVNYFVHSGND